MKKVLALFALAFCANAQNTHVQQLFYNSGLLQYVCEAPAVVDKTSVSVADSTLTNIVVSSNVGTVTTASAHNLFVGARVVVSGSSTSALNGTYTVATIPSSTTYTIATSGVSDATYTTGLVISTNSPLLTTATWHVLVMTYTSGVMTGTYPGGGNLSLSYKAKCSDRSLY